MRLLIQPHNDDGVLFAAFTIMREKLDVLTVFDSYIQTTYPGRNEGCDATSRRTEDLLACTEFGSFVRFCGVRDDEPEATIREKVYVALAKFQDEFKPTEVWLPAVEESGHDHHNLVGEIGEQVFCANTHRYLTYTRKYGRSTDGKRVPTTGDMVYRKLKALAQYKSQIVNDALGCWPHFIGDQTEYIQDR